MSLRPLRHRHFDGVIISMPQSGTHWIRYMLSLILARLHDLPPLSRIGDKSIVGSPKFRQIPRILQTHRPPHYMFRSRTLSRWLHLPRRLVLVRDIRDSLVSQYEKYNSEYNVDFSAFLRGGVRGKKYSYYSIWTRIQFLNGWGAVVTRNAEEVAVLKYEDLKADTPGQLARVCDHFDIKGVTPDLIAAAAAAASKEEMAKRENLRRKTVRGKPAAVRLDPRPADEWYSDADRRFVAEVLRRNLKYTFGYRYW
ncbi:MAG: sulfotransferase domain-containing protein [Proteobacteria bacterium]|nr:sulfotransferase domain-containing protein [Pseudomonadota bacterium]